MNLLEIATQSPLKTGLGLLSKKARKKARKKAKRKAKKARAQQAEALAMSTGMSNTEARKVVDSNSTRTNNEMLQRVQGSDGEPSFLMKDFLGLQKLFNTNSPIPTIPVVAGLYLAMPTIKNVLGMGKAPARRRRKATRRRTYRRRR